MVKIKGKQNPQTISDLYSLLKHDLDEQRKELKMQKKEIEVIKNDMKKDMEERKRENDSIMNLLNQIRTEIKKDKGKKRTFKKRKRTKNDSSN